MRMIPVLTLLASGLVACSPQSIRQGAYEAAYQKGCMDQEGRPNCDPSHADYDTYRRQRDGAIESRP